VRECDWQARKSGGSGSTENERRDVESFEISEAKIFADVDGTECEAPINSTCIAKFKYSYQSSSQGRSDTLQVFYSPKELVCTKEGPIILWYVRILHGFYDL